MNQYLAYIRVSTARQGERGVSLQEQHDAILRYAERNHLEISRWFEERETAAKRGRPIFNEMLKLLRSGKTRGVLIHKIDRSARNMKDWAELGELIDAGVEVHFVNESLDLASRGGRLSADIQAVVAADYIRNLREESRKGFYGRIKQGLFPLPAPLGYLDRGAGKPKELDPVRGPLVKRGFHLYASGHYTLETLLDELRRSGLRNRNGNSVSLNGLSTILNNPFYIGLIRLKSKETFPGIHEPLISKSTFDKVQLVLRGKIGTKVRTHEFVYRRLVRCAECSYALIGEHQKGHAYYRCHTKECPITSVREEAVEDSVSQTLAPLRFGDEERLSLFQKLDEVKADITKQWEAEKATIRLRQAKLRELMDRVTDAYLEHLIDKDTFESRKAGILMEQKAIEEKLAQPKQAVAVQLQKFLELAMNAPDLYEKAFPDEKRELLTTLTSNRTASGKKIAITLKPAFQEVANRHQFVIGRPSQGRHRTLERLIQRLIESFTVDPVDSFEGLHFSNSNQP
jgi:site-specific DNA recombinase